MYVDLDGTLTPSDLLLESCLLLVRKNFLYVFALVFWAFHGPWRLKCEVSTRVSPHVDVLPIHVAVLDRLNQLKAAGHRLVLASASMHDNVIQLASRLGLFDHVIASQTHNLKGASKLEAILSDSAGAPFIYFGDSSADLAVWRKACLCFAVNPSSGTRARAKRLGIELNVIRAGKKRRWRVFVKAMRPQQWAKNSLLFLPLLAAHESNLALWAQVGLGFLAFGLLASATYIWNDLMDLNADRRHPRKKHRPMASGVVSIPKALFFMKALGLSGFALAFFGVGWEFACVLGVYTVVTLFYTLSLKRVAFVDVLVLAMLYTLRVIAGGVATGIEVSSWLLAISLFVFLSLALVKRCAELEFLQIEGTQPQGRGYRMTDLSYLVSMGISSGFVAVLVLALYVDSQNGSVLYQEPRFLWGICPLFLYWIMRIWILTSRKEMMDDPVHFAIHDRISWMILFFVVILAVLAA